MISKKTIKEFINNAEKGIYSNNESISVISSDLISELNIKFVSDEIENFINKTQRKRCILLLDDAALNLTPDYMIAFFDVFRSLISIRISPKATVYPRTTEYGPRFHIGQDVTTTDAWISIEDDEFDNVMEDLFSKRFGMDKEKKQSAKN